MKKNTLKLFLLFIFVLLSTVIITLFTVEKKYKIKQHLEGQSQHFNSIYEATYKGYHALADTLYDALLNKPQIIEIFSQSQDTLHQEESRRKLYKYLYNDFKLLEKQYIGQVQFHLPKHRSFLRMHQPERYGDDLGDIRQSLVYVDKEQKPIDSFEQGRFINAFRFVYPLFQNGTYIGSVEISVSALGVLSKIMQDYDALSNILIRKEVTDTLFESAKDRYIQSPIDGFFFEKSVIETLGDKFNPPQNADEMRQKILPKLEEKKLFSVYNRFQDKVITFIPIKHALSGDLLAYIMLNSHSDYIYHKILFSQISMLLTLLLLAIVLFFIYREIIFRNKLKLSEKKSRTILNATASMLIVWDRDKVIEVNETFFHFFDDCSGVEAFNKKYPNVCSIFHPLQEENFISCTLDKEESWFEKIVDNENETFKTAIEKKGKLYYFILNVKSTTILDQKVYLIELTDISNEMALREELKKKNIQLFHQHKMAQMGEMINMIAHQWRQPLAIINTLVAITKQKVSLGRLELTELEEKLDDIELNTTYMSNTIDDFLQFHKPSKEKSRFSVHSTLEKALAMIMPSLKTHNIQTQLDVADDIFISSHEREFSQVVLALLSNARDVLVEREIKDPKILITAMVENGMLNLTVQDNARGIAEEMLVRVFDPYFSTKETRQGSGLGLYISKLIVESSLAGTIAVYNSAHGAEFSVKVQI